MELLKQAEAAAGDDAALRHRVQVAQLPLYYAFLMRWDSFRDDARSGGADWPLPDSIEPVYETFVTIAKAANARVANGNYAAPTPDP
jgi:hypothetical protein